MLSVSLFINLNTIFSPLHIFYLDCVSWKDWWHQFPLIGMSQYSKEAESKQRIEGFFISFDKTDKNVDVITKAVCPQVRPVLLF